MIKFKEFIAKKDAILEYEMQQASQQLGNKQQTQTNLNAMMKAPPPPGINPQMYQQKIKAAMNISKTTGTPNAASAIDMANAQMKAAQN